VNKFALFTNDVETTSVWHNRLSDKTGEKVLKEGMPRLLDLYRNQQVKCTFFFTGYIAQKFPDIVRMISTDGHEVGCHGLTHQVNQAFDVLDLNQQIEQLKQAKDILEMVSDTEVITFRAPSLRVNQDTPQALEETGFKIDSSVAPQRFDMFLSFGSLKKMAWLSAPRLPYKTAQNSLQSRGVGPIVEVPISAALIPYIGTTLRLHLESNLNKKPIVFLFHPNEVINESDEPRTTRKRAKNLFSYLLADLLRSRLKIKNLGEASLDLLDRELAFFTKKKYSFVTIKDYCQHTGLI
jgi:peptidoglycan/xylan/chitin deacetylase (PgdA/CDA1 family)